MNRFAAKLPPDLRPVPFWAWNGDLDAERLRAQISAMAEMGFGGFFIHSRFGLETPYLGDAWFDCIKVCIDEAEKLGLSPWLYDEDRWPSGSAAGEVTRRHPEYAQVCLDYAFTEQKDSRETTLARFALKKKDGVLLSWRTLTGTDSPGDKEELLRCFIVAVPPSTVANGAPYPDMMNPNAVAEFIHCTHERYRGKLGVLLRKVPGIFTDEPTCNGFAGKLPWTPHLPDVFRNKYGYDLLKRLPELFFEPVGQQFSKLRLDFYNLIAELFTTAYARQIGEWCEINQLRFAGHILGEDDVFSQMQTSGSAMRFYEYMHIPGIDVLTEHWNLYAAAKQCSSVAHQLGRETTLAEVYGCTGWDFPLEGHKAISDWLFALGIDLLVPHHFWYSAAGESKRDYPADISPRSPYWSAYRALTDAFASRNTAFSGMEPVRELLVVHPAESVWFSHPLEVYGSEVAININGAFVHTGAEKYREMGRLQSITDKLLSNHLDFDFGDEEQMSRLAHIENGQFCIGCCTYRAVIVPEMLTIRKTTLALLSKFVRQGGTVFRTADAPQYADGEPSALPAELWLHFHPLNAEAFRTVSLTDGTGTELSALLYRHGRNAEGEALFICNTSVLPQEDIHAFPAVSERQIAYPSVTIRWKLPKGFGICESENGIQREVEFVQQGEYVCFQTSFDRLESRVFLARKMPFATEKKITPIMHFDLPDIPFHITLSEENLLVLDSPEAEIGNEILKQRHFLALDMELRKRIGESPRSIMATQPWFGSAKPERTMPLRLRYRIVCETVPETMELLMESPRNWKFSLNETPFECVELGWKWDPAIRRLRFPTLQKGENTLEVETVFSRATVLESLFLSGGFGVDGAERLTALPLRLNTGNWTAQGLPNYAGNVTYEIPIRSNGFPVVFDLSGFRGSAFRVRLNDGAEQVCAYPPYRITLNPRKGENSLFVTVCGSLRNAFGPFFTKETPFLVTPRTFRQYETEKRILVPYGIQKGLQ